MIFGKAHQITPLFYPLSYMCELSSNFNAVFIFFFLEQDISPCGTGLHHEQSKVIWYIQHLLTGYHK